MNVITLDNYLDFYNMTRTAKIKIVRVAHPSDPEVTVKAIVDNTIVVHTIKVPDFLSYIIKQDSDEKFRVVDLNVEIIKAYKHYIFLIYDELKASGYVVGDIIYDRN